MSRQASFHLTHLDQKLIDCFLQVILMIYYLVDQHLLLTD